ncbi:MAG: ABC transporter permease, partial [Candidatus Paceibacterota bacterium]
TLGGATVATIQGLIVFVITLFVGFRPESFALSLLAVVVMFLVALLFTALGTAIASRLDDMQGFQLITNFLVMPIFFLSGALFPIEGLPKAMSFVTRIDPLSYGVDALRGTLSGAAHIGIGIDILVLAALVAAMMLIGAWQFSKIEI